MERVPTVFHNLAKLIRVVGLEDEFFLAKTGLDAFVQLVAVLDLVADRDDAQVAIGFPGFTSPRQLHEDIVVVEAVHLVENDDD